MRAFNPLFSSVYLASPYISSRFILALREKVLARSSRTEFTSRGITAVEYEFVNLRNGPCQSRGAWLSAEATIASRAGRRFAQLVFFRYATYAKSRLLIRGNLDRQDMSVGLDYTLHAIAHNLVSSCALSAELNWLARFIMIIGYLRRAEAREIRFCEISKARERLVSRTVKANCFTLRYINSRCIASHIGAGRVEVAEISADSFCATMAINFHPRLSEMSHLAPLCILLRVFFKWRLSLLVGILLFKICNHAVFRVLILLVGKHSYDILVFNIKL